MPATLSRARSLISTTLLGSAHRAFEPNCCSSMATRPGLLLPSGSTSRYRSSVWM